MMNLVSLALRRIVRVDVDFFSVEDLIDDQVALLKFTHISTFSV